MKQGRSLQEFAAEVMRQSRAKLDRYGVPAAGMELMEDGDVFDIGRGERYGMTGLFHTQLGEKLGIPAKYYRTMQEKHPDLLAENVNTWLSDQGDKKYLVRTLDGNARALLSNRYGIYDNDLVANTVLPLFAGTDRFEVVSSEITENKMYLKILNKRLTAEVVPGDIVQAGVCISNSEVGLAKFSIQPLVYRLVCTNGMVVNALGKSRKHVGKELEVIDGTYELYSDETRAAEREAFRLQVRDVAKAAVEEAVFYQAVGKLKEAKEAKMTGDVPKVVNTAAKDFGLSQPEESGVLRYLIEGGDLSLYGLSNAVTRESQDVDSYDRASDLERIGGDIISIAPKRWKEINAV